MSTHPIRFALLAALVAACAPESTSFRTTDHGDGSERGGAPAAAYDVKAYAEPAARVHVWSNGGYIGTSDEPMTHFGLELDNLGTVPIVFDSDMLALALYDQRGATLPPAALTAVVPLGPAQVPIAAGGTTTLDVYFRIPVRPRAVERMRLRWSLRVGDERYVQYTGFVRDDEPLAGERRQANVAR